MAGGIRVSGVLWHRGVADGRRALALQRRQVSVTAGTIFQDSRLPLMVWFRAVWHVTSQKNGVSALGLQRALGLGSHRTARALLHKLRRAMVRPGREQLRGQVEVDETCWGSPEPGLHGRQTESKILILIAAEEDGAGIGRIRLRQAPTPGRKQLHEFIGWAAEPGSRVRTDGLPACLDRRKSASRGKLFFRLAQQAVAAEPHPLEKLRQTTTD